MITYLASATALVVTAVAIVVASSGVLGGGGDSTAEDRSTTATSARSAAQPTPSPTIEPLPLPAAPYLYLGWGDPPDPTAVMAATGVKAFTMAFILSSGDCTPAWDGVRPLAGGRDEAAIAGIRAAGGDVVVSFGGWSGRKLGEDCGSAAALAAAYQSVIDAYQLKVIDIDIENSEFKSTTVQDRVLDALRIVKQQNPGITTIVTIETGKRGPTTLGTRMIERSTTHGSPVDNWTIMPFAFDGGTADMGDLTIAAADGLHATLRAAYPKLGDAALYRAQGISTANGRTETGETITAENLRTMLDYAQRHRLGRLAFWSVNRDRACGAVRTDVCGGNSQPIDWLYTGILAEYTR